MKDAQLIERYHGVPVHERCQGCRTLPARADGLYCERCNGLSQARLMDGYQVIDIAEVCYA